VGKLLFGVLLAEKQHMMMDIFLVNLSMFFCVVNEIIQGLFLFEK
jgi:hypothetical protein